MNVELRKLSLSDDHEIFQMVREIGPGENGFVNGLHTSSFDEFQRLLRKNKEMSEGINLDARHVPQTIYWIYADGGPVGYGKLRHCLNDSLKQHGGHIGYVIRPSCRNKGYGHLILSELVKEANGMGIEEVLLTCDEGNIASRKIIERNNGLLESVGNGICKYWIQTTALPSAPD